MQSALNESIDSKLSTIKPAMNASQSPNLSAKQEPAAFKSTSKFSPSQSSSNLKVGSVPKKQVQKVANVRLRDKQPYMSSNIARAYELSKQIQKRKYHIGPPEAQTVSN